MKVDSCSIMRTIAKTTSHSFDLLDLAVYRLAQSIGDAMARISNNVVYMSLNHLGRLLDGLKSRMCCPEIPSLEIVSHRGLISVIPQMSKVFLDRPRSTYLQVLSSQYVK